MIYHGIKGYLKGVFTKNERGYIYIGLRQKNMDAAFDWDRKKSILFQTNHPNIATI